LRPSGAVTPIALVVLAAATASYALFVDRARVSDADRAARKRDVFPSFRADEVRRVELLHGDEVLVLERTSGGGAGWMMTSPRRGPADAAAVDTLTRELETAVRVRDVPPAEASGMETPRVRGRVSVGPIEYHFVLGGAAPRPFGAAYMRVDGEGTFVAERALGEQLLRGADAYRDRTLVAYGEGDVARLELQRSSGILALERSGSTFRVGDDRGLRASRAAVDRLFAALAEVRAVQFLDDAQAGAAATRPTLTVTLAPRDESRPRVVLFVGDACPSDANGVVVVRGEPDRVSACVAKQPALTLREAPEALVDDSPLFAHADEIEDLRLEPLEGDGPRVELARRGGGWHERAPEDQDLSGDEVDSANALARALSNARAQSAQPETGLAFTAHARVTAVRTGKGTTEVVELAAPGKDGGALARRLDDGAILRLSAPAARRFEPHPIALHPPALWKAPFGAAAVVAIDDSCGPSALRIELRGGVWRTSTGKVADGTAISDLLGLFARARADSWVDESDDGSFGLSGPGSCSVGFTFAADEGGARRTGLVFGSAGEDGVFARTLDDQGVLVAPAALREAAQRVLVK
jgi:hypothetical protein